MTDADYYQLLERPDPGAEFAPLSGDEIVGTSFLAEMPLHLRWNASYILQACNEVGCTESAQVDVTDSLAEAVGYFKAFNAGEDDYFGWQLALSADGNTLAVGAYREASSDIGIGGNPNDNMAPLSGAVYVFVRDADGTWVQQEYIKAANASEGDRFGVEVAISADGNTLAVGANSEDSSATDIGGDASDNSATEAGAVYVFVRTGEIWTQEEYIKASNTDANDLFGESVALSADGNTLAVGAVEEDSNAKGIGGNPDDDSATQSGAVYVFSRLGAVWSEQAYIKASNTDVGDFFGTAIALSADGNTLAVGAQHEDSNATGIDGDSGNNSALDAGAAYVFVRSDDAWSQQVYIKAAGTDSGDYFGIGLDLSADGNTLAVGAYAESGSATDVDGDFTDNSAANAGAAYVYTRTGDVWGQQGYIKASNTEAWDRLGYAIALSGDGSKLAVGAYVEASNAVGVGGVESDNSVEQAGAVYFFTRTGAEWSQHAYVKASNTGVGDYFGTSLALSDDGNTLAISAHGEASSAVGINGDQRDNSAPSAGAVYLY